MRVVGKRLLVVMLCAAVLARVAFAASTGDASAHASAHFRHEARRVVAEAQLVALNESVVLWTVNTPPSPGDYAMLCLRSAMDAGIRNGLVLNFGEPFALAEPSAPAVVTVSFQPSCDQPDERRRVSCARLYYLRELLRAGVNVLQADVDVFFFSNPFPLFSLHDVQSMTDGVIMEHAYGYPVFSPSVDGGKPVKRATAMQGQVEFRVNQLNIGFMFLRASQRSLRLLETVTRILAHTNTWEQLVVSHLVLSFTLQGIINATVLHPGLFMQSGFYINNNITAKPVVLHASHNHPVNKPTKLEFLTAAQSRKYASTPDYPRVYVFDFNESPYAARV